MLQSFSKGQFSPQLFFPIGNWNKTNVYEIITQYKSCQQCRTVSNSVNSVNSFNSYSAVLPPSPMVFFLEGGGLQFSNSSSIFSFCIGVYRVVQKAWVLSEKKFVCMPWVLSLFYLESCVHPKLLWSRLNWDWTQWSAVGPSHQVPLTYYHHYALLLI